VTITLNNSNNIALTNAVLNDVFARQSGGGAKCRTPAPLAAAAW